jgi:hypothetical protein
MSRVRANSSGTSFKAGQGVGPSKSFGDLSHTALGMSLMTDASEDGAVETEDRGRDNGKGGWKRVVSEGMARRPSEDNEDTIWDNRCVQCSV